MTRETLPPLTEAALNHGKTLNAEIKASMQKFAEAVRRDEVHPIQAASISCTALGDALATACVLAIASGFPRDAWLKAIIETLNEDIDKHYASFMEFRAVFRATGGAQ